jgi:mannose-1-phosphate guanylyltransferase
MKIVILAGGSGTRLWPLSRADSPKQIHPLIGADTLLQITYRRLLSGFERENIFIATREEYAPAVREQLPDAPVENIISEPCKRDTAAAVGLAATMFYFRNPKEIIATVHADHFIDNENEYLEVLKKAEEVIKKNPERGALIGVKPTYPETGFGYIKMNGQFFTQGKQKIFLVERFVEKPALEQARQYVSQWQYLWNPGYFIWRVDTLLKQYKINLPEYYQSFIRINRALETPQEQKTIRREFNKLQPIAFDYGILEKAGNLLVLPADFIFTDVGNWRTVKEILHKQGAPLNQGEVILVDSGDNLIYNFTKCPIACVGLKNMIIVATEDSTLICREDCAQDVKKVVEKLKAMGKEEYL